MAKSKSIQQKIMRVIMLTSGVVLLLTCAAFFIYELITFRDITRQQLSTLSEIVAANSTAAIAFDDKEAATEILHALNADKHIETALLFDKQGNIFAKYPANAVADRIDLNKEGQYFIKGYLVGYQQVVHNNNQLGTLYIKFNLESVNSRFQLYGLIAAIFILVSFLLAYLISKRLQRTISRPILELAETAEVISKDNDFSVRVVKRTNDEVGALTDAFNHMLAHIESQNTKITAFTHELEYKVQERTKELEEANFGLKQQNEFVETILNSSVDLIAVFDKEYRFLIVNHQMMQFYNKNRSELIGKELLEVFPQVKDSTMFANMKRALSGEVIHDTNYKSAVVNRQLENFYIPLRDKNDNIDRVLVIGHDISTIMEANEKLTTLNMALEKSNRDLEQFAYVASHDLQEPLRKIQVFSELSEKNVTNTDILVRYLNKINSSAQRMTELIKAVLNYSRLSKAGQKYVSVDLNTIIDSLKTDLELAIEDKNAIINTEKLPIIKGVHLQINQLFLNLLSNALKFTKQTPVINITYRDLSAAEVKANTLLHTKEQYVEICFSDNGIGFDQQYADKIFTIFQRLHTNENYAGTGIGLALCKKIVENHLGSISVESKPGEGTTFFICLPADYDILKSTTEVANEHFVQE